MRTEIASGDDVLEAANGSLMATNSRLEKELAEAKAEIEQLKHENLAYQTRMHNDELRIEQIRAVIRQAVQVLDTCEIMQGSIMHDELTEALD